MANPARPWFIALAVLSAVSLTVQILHIAMR